MSIALLFIMVAGLLGSTVLVGAFAFLFSRISRIEGHRGTDGRSDHLIQRVEAMEEELLVAQSEIAALAERLDFTEKLLSPGGDEPITGGEVDQ